MEKQEERNVKKRILPAISLVGLMLLSTQLMVLQDSGDFPEEPETTDFPKRTAYQQLEQFSAPVQGDGQNQPASTFL